MFCVLWYVCLRYPVSTIKRNLNDIYFWSRQYQVPLGCPQNVQEKLNKISFEMISAEFENLFQVLPTRQLHVQALQQGVKYVPVCLLLTLNISDFLF